MRRTGWFYLAIQLLLLSNAFVAAAPRECSYRNKTLVIALLALHHGENCDMVSQRGAQQMAALDWLREYAIADTSLPQLEIRVLDTCSSEEKAVKAALTGLVQAQQGCQGPFFLGFIGPDDLETVRAVSKVISVFNFPHVIATAAMGYTQFGTINVAINDPTVTTTGLRTLLKEINWSSFYLAFVDSATTVQMATQLLGADELCIFESAIRFSPDDYVAYNRLLHALQTGNSSRVLILADTAETAKSILTHIDPVVSRAKFIVYVQGSGILPWGLSKETARNTLILHKTSKSTILPDNFENLVKTSQLWQELRNQSSCETGDCDLFVQDTSTTDLVFAMHLYREALRTGMALRCRPGTGVCPQLAGMPPQDWRTHLEATTAHIKTTDGDTHSIRFHMILPDQMSLFANNDKDEYEQIGRINDGELLLSKRNGLPIAQADDQCSDEKFVLLTEPPQTTTVPTATTTSLPLAVDIFGFEFHLSQLGYYELVAVLTGIAAGMIIIITIFIFCVYRCFHVKVEKTFSSPSSTSGDRTPRKNRKQRTNRAREFFRNSIRSNRTVQE